MSLTKSATIRCYCHGFGDCFLITFKDAEDNPQFRIVIDCGILGGSRKLNKVIEDIRDESGGKIDALVITHEHQDHLSGFKTGQDLWKEIEVGEIWLAWTEDPLDGQATQLQHEARAFHQTLQALVPFAGVEASDRVSRVLAFSESTAESFDFAKSLSDTKKYYEPGDRDTIPNTTVEMVILGPPRDVKLLSKEFLKEPHSLQLFGLDKRATSVHTNSTEPNCASYEQQMREAMGLNHQALESPFSTQHSAKLSDSGATQKKLRKDSWRMIGSNSDIELEHLALQFDRSVNNTSLVIAFLLGDQVLLFPGDAQGGNWKSWEDYPDKFDLADLLRRTTFYKIGHHGSHNATYFHDRADLFPSDRLVSFMPFECTMRYPSIPDPRIYAHFLQTTRMAVSIDAATAPSPFVPSPTKEIERGRPLYVDVTFNV